MKILVATDGTLDPEKAADAVARHHKEGDSVIVATALNVPVEFLTRLGASGVKAASEIAHAAGHPMSSGDRAAERLAGKTATKPAPPADPSVMIALEASGKARVRPIVDALDARGIGAKGVWRTTENQTARTIIQLAKIENVGLIVIGSHGHGRFEGLLGSTGTKLVRHAPIDVLVIRNPVPQ
jgi:nucleotide-binding universal stress UspA family protein